MTNDSHQYRIPSPTRLARVEIGQSGVFGSARKYATRGRDSRSQATAITRPKADKPCLRLRSLAQRQFRG